MRYAALLACVALLLVAGCTAGPGATTQADTTTVAPTDTTDSTATTATTATTAATTTSSDERFDGDANAHVAVYNGENDPWNATVRIERDGALVLNESRTVAANASWSVTTIDEPGNYTFTVSLADGRTATESVRLPRAVGDRDTFVTARSDDGDFHIRIYWEQ